METGNGAMLGIVPEQLTEDNYEYWKVCLKSYLVSQGLWDVVSGRKPKPEKRSPDYESWRRQNAQALHAIQLSCGSDLYFQFRKTHIAKEAWDRLAEKRRRPILHLPLSDHEEDPVHVEHHGSPDHLDYSVLFKAVENGDWKGVKTFLKDDPTAVSARISSKGDTALHVAILAGQIKIAEELVKLTPAEDLELTDEFGCTTLSLAAISGVTRLAKALIQKNHNLLRIANEHDDGVLPVTVASLYGRKRMVRYLYSVTPQEEISPERGEPGATLLNCLITAEIYDVAADLLHRYPQLAFTKDHYENYTLRVLAHKPSAFASGCKLVFWKKWIYSCINVHLPWDADEHECESHHAMDHRGDEESAIRPQQGPSHRGNIIRQRMLVHSLTMQNLHVPKKMPSLLHRMGWILLRCFVPDIKHLYDRKLVHHEVHELLGCIFKEIPKLSRSKLEQMGLDDAIYDAIKHGIIEFVVEILKYNPDIVWRKDNKGRTIFSHAIVLRQEKIFSLIHGFGTKKCIMARRHDIFRNNFLHLAAKLSPPNQLERVNGAALQMQRELQWFKEVEGMVQPKYKEEMNEYHKTPTTLFTDEHKELVKEGERWMKNTAGSSMIVGTLIAAVMFTTAFTVPGGTRNDTGLPIFLGQDAFLVFTISNSLSMFTSSTSVLMFLGILTARYAEEDFLVSLPTKLIAGLSTLFVSIATMMVAFGSALFMMLHAKLSGVSIAIIILSTIPITLFSALQFPLLLEMITCTYGSRAFHKPKKISH